MALGHGLLRATGLAVALTLGALAGAASAQDRKETGDQVGSGYVEMPAATDGAYALSSPPGSGHNWGKPEFIRFLVAVAREWNRRHPDLPKVCVGDMSHQDGSAFPPHKTHTDGLTADIVTRPVNVCHVSYPHPEHQVELAELFAAYGARQILFNGDAVVAKVKVAQKYEKHDDHFHVVLDPKKLPDDTKPLVVPAGELSDGATFGGSALDREGKLLLRWTVMGGSTAKVKTVQVSFDDLDDANGVLFDPGPQKPGKENAVHVAHAIENGSTYRWKLSLELVSGETVGFEWQKIKAELTAPVVELEGPPEDAAVSSAPELSWRFEKAGSEQARFVLELSENGGKKVSLRLGPVGGKEGRFVLRATPLRKNQRYHWRVRVHDSHGNEAVSEWRSWKTTMDYKFAPPAATAARACELVGPDGRPVAKLKKGDALLVLGESDERLAVRASRVGAEGFVERASVTFN